MCIKLVNYWDKYAETHGQQNDKYAEMHGQQNDKYAETHGQQNDKYAEMHGQQNVKINFIFVRQFKGGKRCNSRSPLCLAVEVKFVQ